MTKYTVTLDVKCFQAVTIDVIAGNDADAERLARQYYDDPEHHDKVTFGDFQPEDNCTPGLIDIEEE